MTETTTNPGDVLTLSEGASLLRVEDVPLAELASGGTIPARKIGEEWRFSRSALVQWLHSEPVQFFPPCWPNEASLIDKLALLFEQRRGTTRPSPPPGSEEAVGKHLGAFAGDGDMEKELAQLATIRNGNEVEARKGISGPKRQTKE